MKGKKIVKIPNADIRKNADNMYSDNTDNADCIYSFANTLNKLIDKHNIQLKDIVKETGIPDSNLLSYRKGLIEPKITTIKKLAKYFEVDCNYLITGQETANTSIKEVLNISDNAIKALAYLNKQEYKPDILFLDIAYSYFYDIHDDSINNENQSLCLDGPIQSMYQYLKPNIDNTSFFSEQAIRDIPEDIRAKVLKEYILTNIKNSLDVLSTYAHLLNTKD